MSRSRPYPHLNSTPSPDSPITLLSDDYVGVYPENFSPMPNSTLSIREVSPRLGTAASAKSRPRFPILTGPFAVQPLFALCLVPLFTFHALAAPSDSPSRFEAKLVAVEPPREKPPETCAYCFFNKGATDDMFSGRAELATPPPINILSPVSGKAEEEPAPSPEQPQDHRSQIAKEFGAPEEEDQILGDEKAPKAFRGMMHALEAGDKELAFKYARRYTRYINKLRERTTLVTKLSGLGAEIEGYRPRLDHSEESDPSGYLDIYEKQLEETVKNESAVLSLNPAAQELLAKARQEEIAEASGAAPSSPNGPTSPKPLGEAAERALLYKNHQRPLPVDPRGRVNVFFFLSGGDLGPQTMLGDIQRLKDRFEKDNRIAFKGISLVSDVKQVHDTMQRRGLKITFPIEFNRELAAELGISHTPAVVVMASSTGEYVLEKGQRTVWYLDELIRAVQGGRPMSGGEAKRGNSRREKFQ